MSTKVDPKTPHRSDVCVKVITDKNTLPAAVDFEDRGALSKLDDAHLLLLIGDCEKWSRWMTAMEDGLSTDAGRTEWSVQMGPETDEVGAAHSRVRDEIEARRVGVASA